MKINSSQWNLLAGFSSLTIPPPFGHLFSCWFEEFGIQSADGQSVLGPIRDSGCRLKKSVCARHVIPRRLHALEVSGKLRKLWSRVCSPFKLLTVFKQEGLNMGLIKAEEEV